MGNTKPDCPSKWVKGQSGNPGGIPKAVRERISRNRDKAVEITEVLLDTTLMKLANAADVNEQIRAFNELLSTPVIVKLLKDAQDREMGTPVNITELTGKGGAPIQVENGVAADLAAKLARLTPEDAE